MAYERTWASALDQTYIAVTALSYSQYQLWSLKAMLCGQLGGLTQGLWSVYSSCDSVTAGNGDGPGTDRWGSTFDASKIVRGASGANVKSWVVLSRSIAGITWYFTILFEGPSDTIANFYLAKTAPTAGNTTTRPSSADEFLVGANSGSLNAGGTQQLIRSNLILSSTGDFIFFTILAGAGFPHLGVAVINPVGCHASDVWPLWAFKNYGTVPGPFIASSLNSTSAQPNRTAAGVIGGNYLLTAAASMGNVAVPDLLTNKHLTLPPYVLVSATAGGTWNARGRLPDIFVIPQGSTNIVMPYVLRDVGGTITHYNIGYLFVPAPGGLVPSFS